LKRRLPREYAFKILFMIEVGKNDPACALHYLLGDDGFSDQEKFFCRSLVEGVLEERGELDKTLSLYLINWQFDRLSAVVRNILRLALYELLYLGETPPAVAINEAIELTKTYQDEEAARFVNGMLDNIWKTNQESKPSC
jgi:N utilization substance protein B